MSKEVLDPLQVSIQNIRRIPDDDPAKYKG